ncbi:MAG: hypothetical protein E7409_01625 [Ruminococcaceae bacterium]|nr:hypothetical protein [Oscillospiraceae bacterium]
MKKLISAITIIAILVGMMIFPVSVGASSLVLDEQFSSPYPYTPEEPNVMSKGPFTDNNVSTWEVLTPRSEGYPAGATGNVMKLTGAGGNAYYPLPSTSSGEPVSFEIRFHWDAVSETVLGFGDNLARIYFLTNGVIRGEGTNPTHSGINAGWHQFKFVNVPNQSGVYNTFDLYKWDGTQYVQVFDGLTPRYSTSDQVKVTKLLFAIGAGTTMYVDWMKVSLEESEEVSNVLSAPANLAWDGKQINWDPVEGATAYEVNLLKSGTVVESYTITADNKSYHFGADLARNGDGSYTAEVVAKGKPLTSVDSAPATTGVYNYVYVPPTVLTTPSKPVWFRTVVKWDEIANATGYQVTIYNGDTPIKQFKTVKNAYNAEMELFDIGSGQYSADVIALGDGGDLYADSARSARSDVFEYVSNFDELTVFYDTFNADTGFVPGEIDVQNDGLWYRTTNTETTLGNYLIADAPADDRWDADGYALRILDGSGIRRSFNAKGTLVFEMLMYPSTGSETQFRINSATDAPNGNLIFKNNVISAQMASGSMTVCENMVVDAWNKLKITFERSPGSSVYDIMNMEVNGIPYEAAIRFGAGKIVTFHINCQNTPVYFDNFRLGGLPAVSEPEPLATGVRISGDDSGLLRGNYAFFSELGATEGATRVQWYRSNTQLGTYTPVSGATDVTYNMGEDDLGKWFQFEVIPVDHNGIYGEAVISEPYMHRFKPSAQNVCYTDDGIKLTASYVYTAFDSFREGASKYRWLYCDTKDGQYIPIPGETSLTYTPTPQMRNKYIKFEVTPVTIEGVKGEAALSLPNALTAAGKELMLAASKVTMETISGQKNTAITQDLSLPASVDGIAISWSSTDTTVVTALGRVTQPREGGNKYVTLTMTMEKDGETFRKSFKLCVPAQNPYGEIFDKRVESLFLTVNNSTFRDVTTADWFYADVMWAVSDGWFVGVSQDLFEPEGLVTLRMAQILKSRFDGVAEPAWAETPYITRGEFLDVLEIGTEVLKGDENGDLLLDKTLTRAEACAILHRLER